MSDPSSTGTGAGSDSATADSTESEDTAAPTTGDRDIDEAMSDVRQLEELPVADHHEVLAPAHDRLQQALHRDHSASPDSND